MSEKRKADAVVTFQARDGVFQKFELFKADQFENNYFADQPKVDQDGEPTVRVRHNGQWIPHAQRVLIPLEDAFSMIERAARRQIKSEKLL